MPDNYRDVGFLDRTIAGLQEVALRLPPGSPDWRDTVFAMKVLKDVVSRMRKGLSLAR
jgi:hypothetical protein